MTTPTQRCTRTEMIEHLVHEFGIPRERAELFMDNSMEAESEVNIELQGLEAETFDFFKK